MQDRTTIAAMCMAVLSTRPELELDDEDLADISSDRADALLKELGEPDRNDTYDAYQEAVRIQKELGIEAPGSYQRGRNEALEEAARLLEHK